MKLKDNKEEKQKLKTLWFLWILKPDYGPWASCPCPNYLKLWRFQTHLWRICLLFVGSLSSWCGRWFPCIYCTKIPGEIWIFEIRPTSKCCNFFVSQPILIIFGFLSSTRLELSIFKDFKNFQIFFQKNRTDENRKFRKNAQTLPP